MSKIVVTFGRTERTRGMSFVALSRVKRLEDILLSISLPQYIVEFDRKTECLIENMKKF
jgi:hypothetical protein